MNPRILEELTTYKVRMLPYMPGRRTADTERAFFAIFSTTIGAVEIARILPEPGCAEKCSRARETFCCADSDFAVH